MLGVLIPCASSMFKDHAWAMKMQVRGLSREGSGAGSSVIHSYWGGLPPALVRRLIGSRIASMYLGDGSWNTPAWLAQAMVLEAYHAGHCIVGPPCISVRDHPPSAENPAGVVLLAALAVF